MYIDEDMIADAISELFCYRVPKRLAEYWGDQYVGITSVRHIKSWADLGNVLKSEYEAYKIGAKDIMEQHEIICSQCMAKNKYTRETGYRLELQPYEWNGGQHPC